MGRLERIRTEVKELFHVNPRRLCILILFLSPGILLAQASPSNESGKFRLHKFEQPIGEETYTIAADETS